MENCVGCSGKIIPTDCVRSEEDFSFENNGTLSEILLQLDKRNKEFSDLLSKKIDKKWIKEDKDYIIDYIQDIINQIDLLKKDVIPEEKFKINSALSVGEKTSFQLFTILFKEVEALKQQFNKNSSSMYVL